MVVSIIAIATNTSFSFTSVVKVVYGEYNRWNTQNNNCSSPVFYSAFAYVTAEFLTLAGFIIFGTVLFIYACYITC